MSSTKAAVFGKKKRRKERRDKMGKNRKSVFGFCGLRAVPGGGRKMGAEEGGDDVFKASVSRLAEGG